MTRSFNKEFDYRDDIKFDGPIVHAVFGPAPNGQWLDVSEKVQELQSSGRNYICGGIHTALGPENDPAPAMPKTLRVWYATSPDATFKDWTDVQLTGTVLAATYGPIGTVHIVTKAVMEKMVNADIRSWPGERGIHTLIGDPFPGAPKLFSVWYT